MSSPAEQSQKDALTGQSAAVPQANDFVATDQTENTGGSHAEALKSTSIIGGSTAITMLIRMVRTKVLAILLGPVGVGLEGVYDAIVNVAKNFANLGIGAAGVRQIAASVGTGKDEVIATTVLTMRRVCLVLGFVAAVLLFVFRKQVSLFTFHNPDHATDIGVLSIILLLTTVNGGQGALLQGMRRIGDLAKMGIAATLLGTLVTIPIVYFWGQKGIPVYMVIGAAIYVFIFWLKARTIPLKPVVVSWRQTVVDARNMLGLGLALAASGLLTTGILYLLRVFVTRQEGVGGAGQFEAANKLSVVYVGFILQAMQTDFFPRLATVANDREKANRMVNDQVEVSVLLALPGILGTLAFAPWVIPLFYSSKFDVATEILCWQMAGMLLRVICWPLGTSLVAKGMSKTFLCTELAAAVIYTSMSWLGLKYFKLPGTGMAFLVSYFLYWLIISAVVRGVFGFKWSSINVRLTLFGALAVGIALAAHLFLPPVWATLIGGILTLSAGFFCLKLLLKLVGTDKIRRYLRKFGIPFPSWGESPSER